MDITGTITQDGSYYMVTVPALGGNITQGVSRTDAAAMAAAWVRDMLDRQDLAIQATVDDSNRLLLTCHGEAAAAVLPLIVNASRQQLGLSFADLAAAMGEKSRTTGARIAKGEVSPTLAKLDTILDAVGVRLVIATKTAEETPKQKQAKKQAKKTKPQTIASPLAPATHTRVGKAQKPKKAKRLTLATR